ncbi:MAG: LacI family DNA-binding transcriptional regulator, partial [Candidatus Hydrogenedentes bacterium]|nr:LacI family DNA-binding transcriptional regulator [Candidatus Hydrogenedentota bacterium]
MDSKPQEGQRRAVTTGEVARLCGLSRTTVSAVLNGKATVRESTRRKVLQYLRECHYESGMLSRAL